MGGSNVHRDGVTIGRGRMRVGVIGAGRWGRNIIRILRQMPAVELSCVVSRSPAVGNLVDASCVIKRDWRTLFRRGLVDAVVVATPPVVHAEITAEAVSAGLPVFVEKPLTCDLREAERLFDAVSKKHGYVLVDHIHLFSHAYRALKARLPDIGAVRRIAAEAGAWGPFRADTPVLWDWGPHDAAFCLDLLGMLPISVAAERIRQSPAGNVRGETLVLSAGYPHDVTAYIRLSNVLNEKRRSLLVEGPEGTLLYDDCAEHKVVYRPAAPAGAAPEILSFPDEPPLECALARFVENVSTGNVRLDDLRFGVNVVRMLDAWERVCR